MRRRAQREPPPSPARYVAEFLATGLTMLGVVAVATVWAVHNQARREAVLDARQITTTQGRAAIGPLLSDAVLDGDPAALAAVDSVVRGRVLGSNIVRVKLWDPSGRMIYADRPDLIGRRFPFDEDERRVLATGQSYAEVGDLSRPENQTERPFGKLLEVYARLETSGRGPVLFEAYLPYGAVAMDQRRVLGSLVPAVLGGLVMLFAIQAPVAHRLAARLREEHRRRARLAEEHAVLAHDHERARLALALHDSVAQELAGSAYLLAATLARLEARGLAGEADAVRDALAAMTEAMRDLLAFADGTSEDGDEAFAPSNEHPPAA